MDSGSIDSSLGQQSPAQRAAHEAERDAEKRIEAAGKLARQAEADSRSQIDRIKDSYDKESETTRMRQDAAAAAEKSKGYQRIRDASIAERRELMRTRLQGEKDLHALQSQQGEQYSTTEKKSTEELSELQRRDQAQTDFERKKFASDFESEKMKSEHELAAFHDQAQHTTALQEAQAQTEYGHLKENRDQMVEMEKNRFDEQYAHAVAEDQELLDSTTARGRNQLQALRADHSRKLAAYSERASDPFYQPVKLNANLRETSDGFVLKATIPPHERSHLSVRIEGSEIVLSGTRQNRDQYAPGPGETVETSSYQTYRQTFPLSYPVDAKNLSRHFEGDELIVEVPKLAMQPAPLRAPKAPPERLRPEAPDFPLNLPLAEAAPPERPSRAGRTLS